MSPHQAAMMVVSESLGTFGEDFTFSQLAKASQVIETELHALDVLQDVILDFAKQSMRTGCKPISSEVLLKKLRENGY